MNRCLAKKLGAAVLLCALAGSAFAEIGMYLKGGLGYTYRQMPIEISSKDSSIPYPDIVLSNFFGITPVFGIEPFTASGNAFVRGLSFEVSLDLAFGKGKIASMPLQDETLSSFAITPGVAALYNHRFDIGLKLFGGVGVSVPIQRASGIDDVWSIGDGTYEDSSVKVGFNANVIAGAAYEVTEKIAPYIELGVGFGTSTAFNVRAGVIYRLGGGNSASSDGGDSASAPAEESGE